MLLNNLKIVATCFLLSLSSASVIPEKRSTQTVALSAYGGDIGAAEHSVFFGDGLAWIGNVSPSWLSTVSGITVTTDTSTTTPWTVNSVSSLWPDAAYELYINPTAGAFDQVGFVLGSQSAPTGAVTTGFAWYGNYVAWVASDLTYNLSFWASPTNTTGIWSLRWDSGASNLPAGAFPVSLKKVT